jgi:DUF971 family protein
VLEAPKEISRANTHDVKIVWADDHESVYRAADLRLGCPCATCAQTATLPKGQIRLLPAGIQVVHPLRIELVGQYGMRVYWSDGHSEGIYTFTRLRAVCPCCASQDRR